MENTQQNYHEKLSKREENRELFIYHPLERYFLHIQYEYSPQNRVIHHSFKNVYHILFFIPFLVLQDCNDERINLHQLKVQSQILPNDVPKVQPLYCFE